MPASIDQADRDVLAPTAIDPTTRRLITTFGVVRIVVGVLPLVAAGPGSRLLGFPAGHDTPTTRIFARLFGIRDVVLGVQVLAARDDLDRLRSLSTLNAAVDASDTLAMAAPIVRRQGIDRGAVSSIAAAMTGMQAWLLIQRRL